MNHAGSLEVQIQKVARGETADATDQLAVEEPLEIRVTFGPRENRTTRPVSVTMRTPGDDFDLALGFLFTEGIIARRDEVERTYYCGPETGPLRLHNVVRVELAPAVAVDLARLERHFYTTSSCGVCGKTSIAAIRSMCPRPLGDGFSINADTIHLLPDFLRSTQAVFDRTGGLHAAALFSAAGRILLLREDVGRHNAVDKVVGALLRSDQLPAGDSLLLVSGRASFELVQKALMAQIPALAAVGAPSSLAVELARQFNMTLLGFVRDNRFNIYAGSGRLRGVKAREANATVSCQVGD